MYAVALLVPEDTVKDRAVSEAELVHWASGGAKEGSDFRYVCVGTKGAREAVNLHYGPVVDKTTGQRSAVEGGQALYHVTKWYHRIVMTVTAPDEGWNPTSLFSSLRGWSDNIGPVCVRPVGPESVWHAYLAALKVTHGGNAEIQEMVPKWVKDEESEGWMVVMRDPPFTTPPTPDVEAWSHSDLLGDSMDELWL